MYKNSLLKKFANKVLNNSESKAIKGGRNSTPINTGSYGFVNWDDVEIREPGIVVVNNNAVALARNLKKG